MHCRPTRQIRQVIPHAHTATLGALSPASCLAMSRPTLQDRLAASSMQRATTQLRAPVAAEKDFGSLDALGLARHFQVMGALEDTCAREGLQPGTLHVQHVELEQSLCQWLGFSAARSFQNLGQARLALQLAVLTDEQDLALHDHLNSTALIDPTRLAGCRLRHYPHADAAGAAWQLRQSPASLVAVVTEGIFQADGQLAPLAELTRATVEQQASLLVDDTLGIGCCGPEGRGVLSLCGINPSEVAGLVISLEHALGLQGAVVLGSDALMAHVDLIARQRDLPRPAPAIAAAGVVSLTLARRDQWRRDRLAELGSALHQRLRALGLAQSPPPVSPLQVVDVEGDTRQWRSALLRRGLRVPATTLHGENGSGRTRLRLHLTTAHDAAQLASIAEAIGLLRESIRLQVPLVPNEVE